MQSEDRIIHFSSEFIHPPRALDRKTLQKLYFDLTETRANYDSTDFTPGRPPRFYSRRGEKTSSALLMLPDRFVLVEEWADVSLAEFLAKIDVVVPMALGLLGIPQVDLQTATIRSTFALTHYEDSRQFFVERVCGQSEDAAGHFRRPLAIAGLRFVFPETPDYPGTLHVVTESFKGSRNEVFVEAKGIFARAGITATSHAAAGENVRLVRRFISDNVFPYLDQFDEPEPEFE